LDILARVPEEALNQASETLMVLKDTLLALVGGTGDETEDSESNEPIEL
jgi:hypothetical protein